MTQTRADEEVLKNEFGCVTVIKYKDFWQYVDQKRMTKEKLFKLSLEAREEFYMRWKHGMSDMNVNWEFEYTLNVFLRTYKGQSLDAIDPYYRGSVRRSRIFEEYCNKVKVEIGLYVRKGDLPKEIQDIADKFGGTVV